MIQVALTHVSTVFKRIHISQETRKIMPGNKQGVIKKRQLTADEVREIRELMNICNAYEGLDLKLSPKEGSTGSGDEINDFLYYKDGKLVGFLALDRFGSQDREVAGM